MPHNAFIFPSKWCTHSHWNLPWYSTTTKAFFKATKGFTLFALAIIKLLRQFFCGICKCIIFFSKQNFFKIFSNYLQKMITYLWCCSFRPQNTSVENMYWKKTQQNCLLLFLNGVISGFSLCFIQQKTVIFSVFSNSASV